MTSPNVVQIPEYNARFDPRTGNTGNWLGADSARSVPFGDGRILWLFADTWWRTTGSGAPTTRNGANMTSDSIALQSGPNLATATVTFHQATTPLLRWFPISDTHYSWPMDGFFIGDDLYVFSMRVLQSSPLGGEYGWALHRIPNAKTTAISTWVSTLLYQSGDTATRPLWSPFVEGSYVYSFAIKRQVGWLYCRWPLATFTGTGTQGAVEFFTGAGWSTDEEQAFPISENQNTSEGSVHRRAVDGRWMITDSVGPFPFWEGGVRLGTAAADGSFPVVTGEGGYYPPPPPFQPGDYVRDETNFDAVVQSINPNGTRVIKYTPFWGGGTAVKTVAQLTRKNGSDRATFKNPRYTQTPLPDGYLAYAHKAHPALGGKGLVVTHVDNSSGVPDLSIYWPKFYRILPPTVVNLTLSSTGGLSWQNSGAPDRLMVRRAGGAWVEIDSQSTTYSVPAYVSGELVEIRSIGIGGETITSSGQKAPAPTRTAPPVVPPPDWQIIPRLGSLSRGPDPISNWSKLVLIERHLKPDTWTVTGPSRSMGAFLPGTGCILRRNDKQITSGKLTYLERGRTYDPTTGLSSDTTTATFTSDLYTVGARVILPSPLYQMSTTQIFNFPAAYDLRTGPIETLIINYIRAHSGDQAQLDRQVPRLRLPISQGRGGTTQVSGRFDTLGVLLESLAEAGNLRVYVKHTEDATGAWLDLVVEPVADLSATIRFGTAESTATGVITDWKWEYGAPTATRAIVAGGGELEKRDILERRSPVDENTWGMVSEKLVDQRNVQPLGNQDQIILAKFVISESYRLAAKSVADDEFLRLWVAGANAAKVANFGWSWLTGWDLVRGRDLDPTKLTDLSREVQDTVLEDNTLPDTVDAIRDAWADVRQLDNDIRRELNDMLEVAWDDQSNELGVAIHVIEATNLLDQRIAAGREVRDDLFALADQYHAASAVYWTDRVNSTFEELARGGDELLEEEAAVVKVSFTPVLGPDLEYRRDVRVGDIVGYDLPGLAPAKEKIRQATTTVSVESGQPTERVTVVVGSPDAPLSRTLQQQTARALRNINIIQRS